MAALTSEYIESVLTRYFVAGDRSVDIIQIEEPSLDVDVTIVKYLMNKKDLHDADFCVFKWFTDERTTIFDVGANFGYSATSIWGAGSKAGVISFEPIQGYAPILKEIGKLKNPKRLLDKLRKPKKYEFYITGISDTVGSLEFTTPVINGRIHSALTTADKYPHIEGLVNHNMNYINEYFKDEMAQSFKLYPFTSPVTTIDRWMRSRQTKISLKKIVAMKIDTEGYEGHVLVGASDLLKSQKPLIMAECGHVIDLARNTALEHGYVLAEREGDQLRVSNEKTKQVNGFFLHPDRFKYYRRIGLLID